MGEIGPYSKAFLSSAKHPFWAIFGGFGPKTVVLGCFVVPKRAPKLPLNQLHTVKPLKTVVFSVETTVYSPKTVVFHCSERIWLFQGSFWALSEAVPDPVLGCFTAV